MKNIFSLSAICFTTRQISVIIAITLFSTACSKKSKEEISMSEESVPASAKKGPASSTPANPAILFNKDTTFNYRGFPVTVPAIFVMDADGSHRRMIYHDFVTAGSLWSAGNVSTPKWSGNGEQVCFSGNIFITTTPPHRPLSIYGSISTFNLSLVNGVPTVSNVTKILDGDANSTNYNYPSWSPVANEIALRASQSGIPDRLQIVPSTGGTPVTLYTVPSTDYLISNPCFSPDGSKIAFHERDNSTGEKSIKIIERSTGAVFNSIDLDPAFGWTDLDWSRTPGSTTLIFRKIIPNTGSQGALQKLDFNISLSPVPLLNNASNATWSPDDTQIAYTEIPNTLNTVKKLTLSNNNITTISTSGGHALNWKRN